LRIKGRERLVTHESNAPWLVTVLMENVAQISREGFHVP